VGCRAMAMSLQVHNHPDGDYCKKLWYLYIIYSFSGKYITPRSRHMTGNSHNANEVK
jgi:hypothetical protein